MAGPQPSVASMALPRRRRRHLHQSRLGCWTFSFDSLGREKKRQQIHHLNLQYMYLIKTNIISFNTAMTALNISPSTNLVTSVLMFAFFPACPSLGSLPFHKFPILCPFFRELHLERCQ